MEDNYIPPNLALIDLVVSEEAVLTTDGRPRHNISSATTVDHS